MLWIQINLEATHTHTHMRVQDAHPFEQFCKVTKLLLISLLNYYINYYPAKGNPFLVVGEMTWAVKWPQIAEWMACLIASHSLE